MQKSTTLLLALLFLPLSSWAQAPNDNWTFHHSPTDGWFGALAEAPNGNIVVGGGGANSSFRIFDGTSWALYTQANLGVTFGFYGRALAVDSDNRVWLAPGNQHGISSWNGTAITNYNTVNSGISSNSIFGIAVDAADKVWLGNLQSFDGMSWDTFSNNLCYKGGPRSVFIAANQDAWVYGTYSIVIETGSIIQPCVYRISNGTSTSFHADYGDNLPLLSGGHHLVGELSDGTLFITGKTNAGIEIKTFDGTNWLDFASYTGTDVGRAFWGLAVDQNDNILIGGAKNDSVSQLVKYCYQTNSWTVYDLPEAEGFPKAIYALLLSSDQKLWLAGNVGLCSVPYTATSCKTTTATDSAQEQPCEQLYYHQGNIFFKDCNFESAGSSFKLYNMKGSLLVSRAVRTSTEAIGALATGIYLIQLQAADGRIQTKMFFVQD